MPEVFPDEQQAREAQVRAITQALLTSTPLLNDAHHAVQLSALLMAFAHVALHHPCCQEAALAGLQTVFRSLSVAAIQRAAESLGQPFTSVH